MSPVKRINDLVKEAANAIATAGVAPSILATKVQFLISINLSRSSSEATLIIAVAVPPAFFQNLHPSNKISLLVPAHPVTTDPSTNTAGLTLLPETESANDPKVQFLNTAESPPSTNSATVSESSCVAL